MTKSLAFFCLLGYLQAQQTAPVPALKERPATPPDSVQVEAGTHILLNMINSVSTKQALVGDRLYLETAFPVIANGRVIVPQGSWVTGTVTAVRRPGRVKGKGELEVRFDSLTLPNGVTRNFRGDLGALDASNGGTLDRENSKVRGPSDKSGDAQTVIRTTAEGAAIGTAVGAAAGHIGGGGLIGVASGATGGLIGILSTRGPDATLQRGSTVEMVLDRPIVYTAEELNQAGAPARVPAVVQAPAPPTTTHNGWPTATRPF
jgi:type IV secretion system protein VirB10